MIVPFRNAVGTLGGTLEALAAQQVPTTFEVLLVDSDSSDGSAELAADFAARDPRFRLLHNPAGEPASSRNLGASQARGARWFVTDADCRPEPLWLHSGLEALDRADLVQGRVLPERPPGRWERSLSVGHESGLYETANLMLLPSVFEATGGFRPLTGPGIGDARPFGEDTLFAWRARRTGASTAFAPDAVVRHAVFAASPRDAVAEAGRRGRFCGLVREVPELREHFLTARVFLSPRTARFDLAALGLLAAVTLRRPAALGLALPYASQVRSGWDLAADAVGLAALVRESARTRTIVL